MNIDDPYKAWNIDPNGFPKRGSSGAKIMFLLKYAHLAPSAHNTQPWKFEIDGNKVELSLQEDKLLLYADRTLREAHISLGCALANLLVAASNFNLEGKVEMFPEDTLENVVVRVRFNKIKQTKKLRYRDLFPFIVERRTNRNPHLNRDIDRKIINTLNNICSDEGVDIRIIKGRKKMKSLSDIIAGATEFAFRDKVFKRELSEWVRSVYTRDGEGIVLYDFGIPRLITLGAPLLLRYMPAMIQGSMDRKVVKQSTAAIVIVTKDDTKKHWINTGIAFEIVALYCTKMGLGLAPMGGVIEHDISRNRLKKFVKTPGYPTFFARMGYPEKITHHSPRRSLSSVLV